MKTFMKFTIVLVLLTTLTSCLGGSKAPENLDVEKDFKLFESKKFSVKYPNYLTETSELNDEAELQLQNMFRETYMVVMAESKSDFDFARRILDVGSDSLSYTENYMDMQIESMMEEFNFNITKEKMTHVINDMPAMTVEIDGMVDGISVSYIFTTIESDHDIFYAACWTLGSRKDKYFPTFYQSLETLQQLEYDLESDDGELDIDYEQLLKDLEFEN